MDTDSSSALLEQQGDRREKAYTGTKSLFQTRVPQWEWERGSQHQAYTGTKLLFQTRVPSGSGQEESGPGTSYQLEPEFGKF